MGKKFACLDFVESKDEIPIKYSLVKNMPQKLLDWYVYKYNPYRMESMSILGEAGYNVKLPILRRHAVEQAELKDYIIKETVKALLDINVDILTPPIGFDMPSLDNISVATGRRLIPFFLVQCIEKVLRHIRKDMKIAEVLVLGDTNLTLGAIYNIHGGINYMSAMVSRQSIDDYKSATDHILKDTGLNIQVVGRNKWVIDEADIIVNTAEIDNDLDFAFKRGSVYFDLGGTMENRMSLIRKREDMIVIDNLRFKHGDVVLTAAAMELALYVKSEYYKNIFLNGYEKETVEHVKRIIKEFNVNLCGFEQLGKNICRNFFAD